MFDHLRLPAKRPQKVAGHQIRRQPGFGVEPMQDESVTGGGEWLAVQIQRGGRKTPHLHVLRILGDRGGSNAMACAYAPAMIASAPSET